MIREKKHRLPLECYRGRVTVASTACLRIVHGQRLDDATCREIRDQLANASLKYDSDLAAWCLMPDHLHVILVGQSERADTWRAMVSFKQKTGFWLAGNRPAIQWQKDFYDHIIRSDESLDVQARYALNNPVRAGLVAYWCEYLW